MSALIEELLAVASGKFDANPDDTVIVQAVDLKLVCSQAMARGQMIAIYEELLAHAAEAMTTGKPNLDLANVILRAIAAR